MRFFPELLSVATLGARVIRAARCRIARLRLDTVGTLGDGDVAISADGNKALRGKGVEAIVVAVGDREATVSATGQESGESATVPM